jgi:uncharacterized protein (TIGR02599 family)
MPFLDHQPVQKRRGFTVLEMLVATAVLSLMLMMILTVTKNISATVQHASSKMDVFASSRAGFNIMTQKLSQATLNTYWDYYDAGGNRRNASNAGTFVAKTYGRASDLQFVVAGNSQNSDYGQAVFFQSPEGNASLQQYRSIQGLLNACGFFVQYGGDDAFRPSAVAHPKWRFRLMQGVQPTENLTIFSGASNFQNSGAFWTGTIPAITTGSDTVTASATPLADNVIALVVWPRLSTAADPTGTQLTANYQYDSQRNANTNPQPVTADLDTNSSTPPPDIANALHGRFTDVTRYQRDLDDLTNALASKHITCQILNTSIALQESKWSVTP